MLGSTECDSAGDTQIYREVAISFHGYTTTFCASSSISNQLPYRMTTVNVPESVKSALQSAADMAEGAFSTTLPGLAHTFHHDHQRQPADPSHRNANPEGEHTRKSTAPKDLVEFMVTQLEGKIDNDRLAKQFPTREGMWHGFIDVS